MPETELTDAVEYEAALTQIERLRELEAEPGTAEHEQLRLLSTLVADYEQSQLRAHDPDDLPIDDPEEE
jgi:antitoxin component HigA of HigAB toxin-antitoxin module